MLAEIDELKQLKTQKRSDLTTKTYELTAEGERIADKKRVAHDAEV